MLNIVALHQSKEQMAIRVQSRLIASRCPVSGAGWSAQRRRSQQGPCGDGRAGLGECRPSTVSPPISATESQSNEVVLLPFRAGVAEPRSDRRLARQVNHVEAPPEACSGHRDAWVLERYGRRMTTPLHKDARGSPGQAVCCRADACADENDGRHRRDQRDPEHVALLLLEPLGAADEDTVVRSGRNEEIPAAKRQAKDSSRTHEIRAVW